MRRPLCLPLLLAALGCAPEAVVYPEKAPLPVTVMRLVESTPAVGRTVAGSVRSWKTEDIAFEVNGRVAWVVEPGEEIEGRTYSPEGEVLSPGTQIAQLDDERFVTAVKTAEASVEIAELQRDSTRVQVESGLPSEIDSAKAQLKLAETEFERNERLVAQNAGARSGLDRARANLDAARAALDGLKARYTQAQGDLSSAEASIAQAEQRLRDAKRNLSDTKLYSSFRGQIAAVHVVPGSVASPQTRVATIQMMNPIKVELEVSAEQSRQIRLNDVLPVTVSTPSGERQTVSASVYTIAPSADNATRTFTLTLLVPNRKTEAEIPSGFPEGPVARARFIWRLNAGILPDPPPGMHQMPDTALQRDEKGAYVWRVTNFRYGDPIQRVLEVEKTYLRPGGVSIPFLGRIRYRPVEFIDRVDPERDWFAAELIVNGQRGGTWEGEQMLLDDGGQWPMRPGDIVDVSLASGDRQEGYYVPVEAIHEESGETSVFVVVSEADSDVARQVPVRVVGGDGITSGSLQRIEAISSEDALGGQRVVLEGVHYLVDGESVNVVATAEGTR